MDERVRNWLEPPFDRETQDEVKRLVKENPTELNDAFFQELSFGTAGMRGLMGVGTNRLNIYTIRMATQGLANYLKKQGERASVFIGYDVRRNSKRFAIETARVLAGNKIKALLSKDVCPTPLVSFACRHYGCSAAIVITASHNPPQYNGYKVYWSDGGQVVPPHDEGIMREVSKIKGPSQVLLADRYEEIGSEIDDAYLKELKKLQMLPAKELKIIYTNLHGTGLRLMEKALASWGYNDVRLVEKQKELNGNFPNAPSPNPEKPEAFKLGIEQLKREKRDLLIATDPDADRIGVATQKTQFTGNQVACLCLYHICKTLKSKREFPANAAFIKSIVTTELFRAIAEDFGGKCIDVLTGFKYISEQIAIWEKAFDGYQYIFGAEESCGYLFGTFMRDKDAFSSACLIAETAAYTNLDDLMDEIYAKYGEYRATVRELSFPESKEGMAQMKALMRRLRENPPERFDSAPIVKKEDYLRGEETLPPSDVIRFWLEDKTKVVIRPSGTEPKVKIYVEVQGTEEKLKKLAAAVQTFLSLDT
jgi:phosphomannomutase